MMRIISSERKLQPELLTTRSNISYHDRKLAGLCPLNAIEVTRERDSSMLPRAWGKDARYPHKELVAEMLNRALKKEQR
ncbi:hypothetical protein IFM89_016165 [Coptis chinensis]|uniref:Uncharacterized protein n=1 Tax=Coptis chinensis TaxID=261450 RepID=A0A835HF23_9MAGN|nr:hypothetical protein IFM89_016165 [Coptis chinensis]